MNLGEHGPKATWPLQGSAPACDAGLLLNLRAKAENRDGTHAVDLKFNQKRIIISYKCMPLISDGQTHPQPAMRATALKRFGPAHQGTKGTLLLTMNKRLINATAARSRPEICSARNFKFWALAAGYSTCCVLRGLRGHGATDTWRREWEGEHNMAGPQRVGHRRRRRAVRQLHSCSEACQEPLARPRAHDLHVRAWPVRGICMHVA